MIDFDSFIIKIMINNLIIIVFFASWTLLFLILILIGYFVEKSYKLASISPKFKD